MTAALTGIDTQLYQFPLTSLNIDDIVSLQKPDNISITEAKLTKPTFDHFIEQVNGWLQWFEQFVDIFSYLIEWLKISRVNGAEHLLSEIHTMRAESSLPVIRIKALVQEIVKILKPFDHLPRLCDLLNCARCFEVVVAGTLSSPDEHMSFIAETRKSHPTNFFTVRAKTRDEKLVSIHDRRHVIWALVCAQHPCEVKVEYRVNGSSTQVYELFSKQEAPIDRRILYGQFTTQRNGQLVITVENPSSYGERQIWFQTKSTGLSTCHLFHGIFSMDYRKYFTQPDKGLKETDLSKVLNQVFKFIDRLLDGDITLADIAPLQSVFHDKNINVHHEVKKLFTSRSTNENSTTTSNDEAIGQVCQWLQTYQYYSHLSNIIECVRKFQLISNQGKDQSIDQLQQFTINDDCSLKEISETYGDLYQRFSKLSNEHLQLIKTMLGCTNVIQMMKQSNLYASDGLRRFHELRDNLTTQFQFQERNNLILNSWIITYTLCEPFVRQVDSLEQFIDNLARLSKVDESSLADIEGMYEEKNEIFPRLKHISFSDQRKHPDRSSVAIDRRNNDARQCSDYHGTSLQDGCSEHSTSTSDERGIAL